MTAMNKRMTVPYHQWMEGLWKGLWEDYEVVGYEFLGRSDVPTSVELKKVIEKTENTGKLDSTPNKLI